MPPTGGVTVNRGMITGEGAFDTCTSRVILALEAQDSASGVRAYRVGVDGVGFQTWNDYVAAPTANLGSGDGLRTVLVQFRDGTGNVSAVYTDTIMVDTSAGSESGISINRAALWTNSTAVSLTLPSKMGTAEMQVSNDGGFFEAQWEPYRLHRDWQITSYGSTTLPRTAYIRYRDTVGTMSFTYQDDIILDVTAPNAELAQLVPAQLVPSEGIRGHALAAVPIAVHWTGSDDLSGVRWYNVQVRSDITKWLDWLTETPSTTQVYEARPGRHYCFRVQAEDNAGNLGLYSDQKCTNVVGSYTNQFLPLITLP